jgi:hypothetical protein
MIHNTRDVCTPGRAHIVCKKPKAKIYFGIGGNDIVLGSVYPSGFTGEASGGSSGTQTSKSSFGDIGQTTDQLVSNIQAPTTNQSFWNSIRHNSTNSAIDVNSAQIGDNCHTAHVLADIPVVPEPDCFTVMGLFLTGLMGLRLWRGRGYGDQ